MSPSLRSVSPSWPSSCRSCWQSSWKKIMIKNNQIRLLKSNFQVILGKKAIVFNKTTVKSKTERRRNFSKNFINVIWKIGKDIHLPSLQFEPLDTFVLCGVKIQLTTTKETSGAKEIMTVIAMPGKRLVINLQNSQLSLSEIWAVQVSNDTLGGKKLSWFKYEWINKTLEFRNEERRNICG